MKNADLHNAHERLRYARVQAGFDSAKAFATKVGLGDVTYRSYENGQVGFAKHAPRFAKLLGVSTDWLLEGSETTGRVDEESAVARAGHLIASDLDVAMVREVDITYALGDGVKIAEYPETGAMPFDVNFLRMLGANEAENVFVCRGQGDSMAPTIYGDDLIMIDVSRNRVTMQDQIWAIAVAGCGMIKRIRPLPDNKILVLSDNPLVPEQCYDADDVAIVGKVIWIGRRM